MNSPDREAYWLRTFSELHARSHDYLDYATAEEQTFTFGACLLAAGPVAGTTCLDAGCGKGGFARVLRALGARQVVGLDLVASTIEALRRSDPDIRWESGDVSDAATMNTLGLFEAVFAIEILQCVSTLTACQNMWDAVAPGGRLIGVVPNGDNAFVQHRVAERPGLYAPLGVAALVEQIRTLANVADWGLMGFVWREDRSSILYDLLPLTSAPQWDDPPKRVLFIARKSAGAPH